MWPFIKHKPKTHNVYRAKIRVTTEDRIYNVTLDGEANQNYGETYIWTAQKAFNGWQYRGGERGMVAVDENEFVPLCNVKHIKVEYEDLFVTVL